MVWTAPDLLPSLFARIAEHRKVKFVRGTRLKRSEVAAEQSRHGVGGAFISSIADVYATAFREYGQAMITEVLELVSNGDGSMEPEASAWALGQLEADLDAVVASVGTEVKESTHTRGLKDVTENRITQILAELKRDLRIAADKAVLKGTSRGRVATPVVDAAMMDTLVPLRNRRAYNADVPEMLNAAVKTGEPLALLAFDVDKFKSVNDDHGGHATGDEALIGVATIAGACSRGKGTAYRLSGDEFRIALPNHTLTEALAVAERVRQTVNEKPLTSRNLTIGISVGVAVAPTDGADLAELDKAADNAAYDAKEAGRNCVRAVGSSKAPPVQAKPVAGTRGVTAAENAALLASELRMDAERRAFLDSHEGVQAARDAVQRLFRAVEEIAQAAGIEVTQEPDALSIYKGGFNVVVFWQRQYSNTLDGAVLVVVEWKGRPDFGGHRYHRSAPAEELKSYQFQFDRSPDAQITFREKKGKTEWTVEALADRAVNMLIERIRANRHRD